uniref:Uncharacterized protein n=1 Tax=Zea mays TaxID=4577 RepID=C4J158_MAIZE|nr:unknown [Zea mays]
MISHFMVMLPFGSSES